jgi:hypothetical protein
MLILSHPLFLKAGFIERSIHLYDEPKPCFSLIFSKLGDAGEKINRKSHEQQRLFANGAAIMLDEMKFFRYCLIRPLWPFSCNDSSVLTATGR